MPLPRSPLCGRPSAHPLPLPHSWLALRRPAVHAILLTPLCWGAEPDCHAAGLQGSWGAALLGGRA
eukprot:365403-Chlamydomonas_euryale.AAC.2